MNTTWTTEAPPEEETEFCDQWFIPYAHELIRSNGDLMTGKWDCLDLSASFVWVCRVFAYQDLGGTPYGCQ